MHKKTKQRYCSAELNDSLYIFEFVLLVDGDIAPTRLQVVCTVLSVRDVINGKRVQLVKRRQIVVSTHATTKKCHRPKQVTLLHNKTSQRDNVM